MLLGRLLSTPISTSSIISVMFLTGSNYPVIGDLLRVVTRLCEDLQASTFSILFHPVREQLALVSSPATIERVWSSASAGSGSQGTDMPEFSFTPQEYITQVSASSPNFHHSKLTFCVLAKSMRRNSWISHALILSEKEHFAIVCETLYSFALLCYNWQCLTDTFRIRYS